MAPQKRPCASPWKEPGPEQGTGSVKAEPVSPAPPKKAKGETETTPKPKAAPKPKAEEPEKGKYPPPSNKAWQDVNYQLKQLQKAGKPSLKKAFDQCKGQQQKREFYYNVFLLSPEVAQKEVHKESLEKATVQSGSEEGWLAKWEVAKKEGVLESNPDFESLADDAVADLPVRDHENPKWAARNIKQYYYTGKLLTQKLHSNQSLTKAKQSVTDLENDHFQQVENALKVEQPIGQIMLGGRPPRLPAPCPAPPEPEPEEGKLEKDYSKAFGSLKKALATLGSGLDKLSMLQESLSKAEGEGKEVPASHKTSLAGAISAWEDKKKHWMKEIGRKYEPTMPECEPEQGKTLIAEMDKEKKRMEEDMKSLNKAISPTRLWAKNEGHLK